LLAFLGRRARKEERSRHPQIVRAGPEVDAVVEVAEQLADRGREDDDAVRQLRAAAKGRRGVLNRALALSRMGPKDPPLLFEVRSRERMDRLLVAAATREPIQPVSAEQAEWFERIDALEAGGSEVAYARVKSQVPELDVLEQEVRARVAASGSGAAVDDDWWASVYDRLEQMVGWKSELTDPVLRSGAAFEVTYSYLGALADIIED
jgi:hypothetical protein